MRAFILVAASALILAGCGKTGQSDNTMNVDENLAAENIVSNDVTAIDAVTGDASNMAADVNYIEPPAVENNAAGAPAKMPTPRTRAPGKPPLEQPTPTEPVTNNAE
ncbi:MAG TPA: hypothetical protein VE221_07160 [Sphingomicrobium sp.]|nr:hypothetical protein [Sphingomicrobium sp.]